MALPMQQKQPARTLRKNARPVQLLIAVGGEAGIILLNSLLLIMPSILMEQLLLQRLEMEMKMQQVKLRNMLPIIPPVMRM